MILLPLILLFFLGQTKCDRHPVLLVPGLGGSQMTAKYVSHPDTFLCYMMNKTFLIWINPLFFLPHVIDCTINLLRLEYNTSTQRTYSPKYCEINASGFGTVDTISYLSNVKNKVSVYYQYIIDELITKHNYEKNVDLRGVPYDFRKAPNELTSYFSNVVSLIEEMYHKNNEKSIILIAHSLGNLFVLKILNRMPQSWKDKYIRSFISISGPYAGVMTAAQAILSGFNDVAFYLNSLNLRKMESTWPSLYYLLPQYNMWTSDPIVLTKDRNFTAKEIPQLLKYSNIPFALNHFKDVEQSDDRQPPNVELHCIFSVQVSTVSVLDYRNGDFPNTTPLRKMTNGDGTVPIKSLLVCPSWRNKQVQKVTAYAIPKIGHIEILREKKTIDYISNIIGDINS